MMNVAIAAVIIQGFVQDRSGHFEFVPGDWSGNADQIIVTASSFGEDEVIELVEKLIEMGMAEHMLKFETKGE